jgi:hypothetical protein
MVQIRDKSDRSKDEGGVYDTAPGGIPTTLECGPRGLSDHRQMDEARNDMSRNKNTVLRLRCENNGCPEEATFLVSRIDASRDYRYACLPHAEGWVRASASEMSSIIDRKYFSREAILASWMPKHRTTTRRDAVAILATAEKTT